MIVDTKGFITAMVVAIIIIADLVSLLVESSWLNSPTR